MPDGAALFCVDQSNWSDRYPYAPKVEVRMWHDGATLYVNSRVDERYVRAQTGEDNGEVWNDSCVELFLTFGEEGYYNFETNCIGRMVASHRLAKNEGIEFADAGVMSRIKRDSSLGNETFPVREHEGGWELTVSLPASAFFKHRFTTLDGLEASGNLYKCGDALPDPHFMSWKKVDIADPDFHRPEYFGKIRFGS